MYKKSAGFGYESDLLMVSHLSSVLSSLLAGMKAVDLQVQHRLYGATLVR